MRCRKTGARIVCKRRRLFWMERFLFQDTFLSLWYWVFVFLFWGVIGNYTFGIPNELLMRSKRSPEEGEIFDRYARRNLAMFSRAIGKRGFVVTALTAFVLTFTTALAIWGRYEIALGLLVILGPMAIRWYWGGRMIEKLNASQPPPDKLRRIFMRERRLTAITAGVSMLCAMGAASATHGRGWTEVLFRGF